MKKMTIMAQRKVSGGIWYCRKCNKQFGPLSAAWHMISARHFKWS